MRRPILRMSREEAERLLQRAPYIHLATTTTEGAPIFRTLHGVVCDDGLIFHAGPKGEKTLAIGREAVASAVEMVAEIPSWFTDPERACPATTYYESVQLHGTLEKVEDAEAKARYMQALMERYQPSGGYVPITAEDPMYQSSLRGLLVLRMSLERLVGKKKLGQHIKPEKRRTILEQLWRRGHQRDHLAIQRILDANPDTPTPSFLQGPEGVELLCHVSRETDITSAAKMLEDAYWNGDVETPQIADALRHSTALVGARDRQSGALVGIMRGLSDQSKHAWIYDVMIAPAWRQRGLGSALMQLLLGHPLMRHAKKLHLQTKDAQDWYARFGFADTETLPPRPFSTIRMMAQRTEERTVHEREWT